MEFYPKEPLDTNIGHNKVWNSIREAFKEEEGLAFYRFPIYFPGGYFHQEIDVLLLLRRYGVFVLECKGYRIENIQSIRGHAWEMQGWYKQHETPFDQVSKQMFALKNWLEPLGDLAQKVRFFHRVALPFISREDWEKSNFHRLPTTQAVSTRDELTCDGLRRWIFDAPKTSKQEVSPEEWNQVLTRLAAFDVARSYTPHQNISSKTNEPSKSDAQKTSFVPVLERVSTEQITQQGGDTVVFRQPSMTLLLYEGEPPSAEYLRSKIPELQENSGYMYVVATRSQERRRVVEGIGPSLQVSLNEEGVEEPQLLFHRALRHWIKVPILRRFEEWVLLRQAMRDMITNDKRRRQLYHDVFAWQRALKRVDEEGIELTDPLPASFAERLVHKELGALLRELRQGYLNKAQQEQPPRIHFEAEARSFLEHNFRPSEIVVMEGFSRLTPLQQLFLDKCLEFGARVFILCPYREKQRYGFEAVHTLYQPLEDRGCSRIEIFTKITTPPGSLLHLQEHIFLEQEAIKIPTDSSVTLEAYTHRHNEVKACVQRIIKYIKEGQPCKEIVVITHDLTGYQPLLLEEAYLQNAPELFNIPPRLLLLTPVGRFALSLYNVWQEDSLVMSAEQFESFLASGLLGLEAQESTDIFRLVKAQVFARCRTEDEWIRTLEQLTTLSKSLRAFQRFSPKLIEERTIELWKKLLDELRSICQRLFASGEGSIREHIRKLLDELERLSEKVLRESERGVLQGIKEALEELSESHSIALSTEEFGEILNGMVQERTDEEEQLRQDRIAVVSPDGLDGHRVSKIFYLGLDNQHVPRAFMESWPFATVSIEDHLRQERYLFLAVIRAASGSLHASFPLTHEGQSFRPSIYLEEAARWLELGGELNRPIDALPSEHTTLPEKSPVASLGKARRKSYDLAEIAHFALCPYRYKLERIDKQAQCYSSPWQVAFAAESFWFSSILSHLIDVGGKAPSGEQALHRWLMNAYKATEARVQSAFPGLRPLEWVGVRQYVTGDLEYFEKKFLMSGKFPIKLRRENPLEIELIDRERSIRIHCEIRYSFQRGKYPYPYTQDTFVEQWLRYGPRPPEEDQEEASFAREDVIEPQEDFTTQQIITRTVQGIEMFVHQYDAAKWWRKAVRDVFYYHNADPKGNEAFFNRSQKDYETLRQELLRRIRMIEQGIYPKNPGEHCKYCPLQDSCLGIEP